MKCDKCGEIDEFMVDGYSFGDRLLEGVMFTIDVDGKARIQKEDEPYFVGLNKEHWLNLAEESAQEADLVYCAKCKGDIYVEGYWEEDVTVEMTPISVELNNLIDPRVAKEIAVAICRGPDDS